MLNLLRSDEVEIQLRLEENASAEPGVFTKRGKPDRALYSARANDFMDVVARVVNNSGLSILSILFYLLNLFRNNSQSTSSSSSTRIITARFSHYSSSTFAPLTIRSSRWTFFCSTFNSFTRSSYRSENLSMFDGRREI